MVFALEWGNVWDALADTELAGEWDNVSETALDKVPAEELGNALGGRSRETCLVKESDMVLDMDSGNALDTWLDMVLEEELDTVSALDSELV